MREKKGVIQETGKTRDYLRGRLAEMAYYLVRIKNQQLSSYFLLSSFPPVLDRGKTFKIPAIAVSIAVGIFAKIVNHPWNNSPKGSFFRV